MEDNLRSVAKDAARIYSHLEDNISREIFENRVMMCLLQKSNEELKNEKSVLRSARDNDKRIINLMEKIAQLKGDVIIYGAGELGQYIRNHPLLSKVAWKCFIDNKKWVCRTIDGLPVCRFADAAQTYNDINIVISMINVHMREDITDQINRLNKKWKIIDAGAVFYDVDNECIDTKNNLVQPIDVSRFIYRLGYTNPLIRDVYRRIEDLKLKPTVFCYESNGYYVDLFGKHIEGCMGVRPWHCLISEDCESKRISGLPVYTYKEYVEQYGKDINVVVGSFKNRSKYLQLMETLYKDGLKGRIVDLTELELKLGKQQYFDFFQYNGGKESFVDAGVYDLASSINFMSWCRGNYDKIFAFEPDKKNYENCMNIAENFKNVKMIKKGIFDRRGVLKFYSIGGGGISQIEAAETGYAVNGNTLSNDEIAVIDMDTELKGEKVTFIKMDIEGSEAKALLGAKNIIMSQKPKLAICVYHKLEDIIELPLLVLGMNADYKIAFRQYHIGGNETVMYAW